MTYTIRPEQAGDEAAIRHVLESAFPSPDEANLVDALRDDGDLWLSLVAVAGGEVVGHAALSPVTVDGAPSNGFGLAPVAVHPDYQREGVGTRLTEFSLTECRAAGGGFAVVLGEPAYYARFGFSPASAFGLTSVYEAGDAFQVLALSEGGLPTGLVRYTKAFDPFGT